MFHVKQTIPPHDVPRETQERLERFAALLREWSPRINLVSRRALDELWPRHIADSLQLLPLARRFPAPWIDLGSGAGFPGLILALASGRHVHLIESDHRKAAFLREAARMTATEVTIHVTRIESLQLPPVSLVTARALAPLVDLLTLATPFLLPDGVCLFPKGKTAEDELTAARARWHMRVERTVSITDPAATILELSELRFVGSGHGTT